MIVEFSHQLKYESVVSGQISMLALHEKIVEKLQSLPEPALREVLMFIEFLSWRTQTSQSDLFLSVIGSLSGEPLIKI
ncbi:MAG: DUF2281 domain-containing protein [Scytonema sp. PMC 1070.18]|nr:DUF2281 domain-containing protein [Scytonema sp. PMC 1070.18]